MPISHMVQCRRSEKFRDAADRYYGDGINTRKPRPPLPQPAHGVGYHLKRVLAYFILFGKAGCKCDGHAATMDRNGPDWCADNIETIIGWMRAEAKKRKLPFMDACGEGMILLAIRNARRDEKIRKSS